MYVLVTDDTMYDPEFTALRDSVGLLPPEGSYERQAFDDAVDSMHQPHSLEQTDDDPRPFLGQGVRVFGPFATYDEGKCAAITLPYRCDYWVIPAERP